MNQSSLIISQRKAAIILLVTPFLLTFYSYFGLPAFYDVNLVGSLPTSHLSGFYRYYYNFLAAFVLFLLFPCLLIKLSFKEKFKAYGFRRGDHRFGLKAVAWSLPIVLIASWLPSRQADFQQEYSAFLDNPLTFQTFIIYAAAFFLYYLSFEFFFRGFLLFGLKPAFGRLNSLLIQTIPCCLVHIGKPLNEVLAAIIASLIFGYLALRTESIWYGVVIHWLIGVFLILFIGLGAG
ncbi:MAG TPA: CPBP family intramembrane metalloprotease [Candidatus Saccharicenans sp.]|nr:CPBP family intramembrane metalloprotease [Candidatus Saccharicenans sp.]HNT00741.1 CPBP family intramembrane metalloprotease [Candidatus Saccharicenans sp.]